MVLRKRGIEMEKDPYRSHMRASSCCIVSLTHPVPIVEGFNQLTCHRKTSLGSRTDHWGMIGVKRKSRDWRWRGSEWMSKRYSWVWSRCLLGVYSRNIPVDKLNHQLKA